MASSSIYILGIESSCDDTSAAIINNGKVLANVVANQDIHESYGGVVPELASRAHQQNIVPVVTHALQKANVDKTAINGVAYTQGPGLLGSLLVGSSYAKAFSLARNIPLLEVNHMQAHILAHFIKDTEKNNSPDFPFLCLTVSGGHTQLVLVKSHFDMEIIGETLDDAAGEAFDKIAKISGLPYPGGPLVDQKAKEGNAEAYSFPHPKVPGFNFSFSGLKTSVLYFLRDQKKSDQYFIENNINDICASVQKTIVDILLDKLIHAIEETGVNDIALAGGVSANSELRERFEETGKTKGCRTFIPKFEYCTDNAAMIAIGGYYKFLNKDFAGLSSSPKARLKF